jgi:hypothetical protein
MANRLWIFRQGVLFAGQSTSDMENEGKSNAFCYEYGLALGVGVVDTPLLRGCIR